MVDAASGVSTDMSVSDSAIAISEGRDMNIAASSNVSVSDEDTAHASLDSTSPSPPQGTDQTELSLSDLKIPPTSVSRLQETLDSIRDGIGEIASTVRDAVLKENKKPEPEPSATENKKDGETEDHAHTSEDAEHEGSSSSEDEDEEPELDLLGYPQGIITESRECSWEDYKSRIDSENKAHAVDALLTRSFHSFQNERKAWSSKVEQMKNGMILRPSPKNHKEPTENLTHTPSEKDEELRVVRVRINSKLVVDVLRQVSGDNLDEGPLSFARPFRYILHFHTKMEQVLRRMESGDFSGIPISGLTGDEQESPAAENDSLKPDAAGMTTHRSQALAELKCYVNFVHERLLPDYDKYLDPQLPLEQKVRYEDLWYLFRVGGLIHLPKTDEAGENTNYHEIWRVYRIHLPTGDPSGPGCPCSTCKENRTSFYIRCYYIDFDGTSYGGVRRKLIVKPFKGLKSVMDLPFFPIQYSRDHQKALEDSQEHGSKFTRLIKDRYGFYSGWTLTKDPQGADVVDSKGRDLKSPEHIESDVLVDFQEAFNFYPPWKPSFDDQLILTEAARLSLSTDQTLVCHFSDESHTELLRSSSEFVCDQYIIEVRETTEFLSSPKGQYLVNRNGSKEPPSSEDFPLLPHRMFAYAVWSRKFLHIDVRYVHARLGNSDGKAHDGMDAFDKLQIEQRHKDLIQGLIHQHFKKKQMETLGFEISSQDMIRGKGKGVVILLHGVPGVGKTATAEAVAQRWGKPLFPITCGDLGFTPQDVQDELEEIFRLAHLWDCVLLLDEADVFLTQREKSDLKRNALVAVFLRMLEYYNGIMFLTTNRAGALDEAVKSRVHLHLPYGHLTEHQTVEIYRINIERLELMERERCQDKTHEKLVVFEEDILKFAKKQFQQAASANGKGRWNGRQIRNAFLIAAAIAHYEVEGKPNMQRQLRGSHFEDVEKATALYDEYREATTGFTDSGMAYHRRERNDEGLGALNLGNYPASNGLQQINSDTIPRGYQSAMPPTVPDQQYQSAGASQSAGLPPQQTQFSRGPPQGGANMGAGLSYGSVVAQGAYTNPNFQPDHYGR